MFTRVGSNEAISDDAFSVKRTNRYELRYTVENKFVSVEVEPGRGLAIYETSITEWSNGNEISPKEKNIILDRICSALDFLNTKYVIE